MKYIVLIAIVLMGLLASACTESSEAEQTVTLTIEEVKALDEQYFDLLFNPGFVDESPKVNDFQTKQALIEYLSPVATDAFAAASVNSFYEEKADGVYIVPTETPPELDLSFDYTLQPMDEDRYQLIQTAENNLYGNYTLTIDYQWVEGQWKIDNRQLEF